MSGLEKMMRSTEFPGRSISRGLKKKLKKKLGTWVQVWVNYSFYSTLVFYIFTGNTVCKQTSSQNQQEYNELYNVSRHCLAKLRFSSIFLALGNIDIIVKMCT